MEKVAAYFEGSLVKGKVYQRNATWNDLEAFFEKQRDEILSDLELCFSKEEIDRIVSKIQENESRVKERATVVC